jgi:hypothetical protein
MMVMVCFKEMIEFIIRKFKRIFLYGRQSEIVRFVDSVGYMKVNNFVSLSTCNKLVEAIERYLEKGVDIWSDDTGSDQRIFYANNKVAELSKIFDDKYINDAACRFYGVSSVHGFMSASKVSFVPGNKGSGGGWHRDSPISHQFKAIIYLNNVDGKNGPFSYVKFSNNKREILRSLRFSCFKPGQYRFTDDEVQSYYKINNNIQPDEIHGSAGDLILVDTKGIHRGTPIEIGHRYALTYYLFPGEIPLHMRNLQ